MTSIRFPALTIESEGEGPAVVMLHGLGGTSNSFQPLVPALSGFRVIRPDLPGAGRSPTPAGKLTVAMLVDAVAGAMTHLGVARAHVVGHSFGTLVAQHLAVRVPERCASLTLFGPIIEPQDAARERLRARAEAARREGMDIIGEQLSRGALSGASAAENPAAVAFVRESHMRQDAEGFARSCEALADAGKADHRLIGCPTLVVTGDEDGVGPPTVARELAGLIKDARSVILDRCGHWTPIERSRECSRLLADFLRGIAV